MSAESLATAAPEARSGLEPWQHADLPAPPSPKGLGWIGVVGPGVIVLGASLGGGEFLLGPAVFVRYGLTLLWVTTVAVFFQTIFNTELMRYTVATGEPVFTGFMRTRPSSSLWAWFYALLFFLQIGWPASAANAAGAIFFLFAKRLAGPEDVATVYYIGVGTFLLCVAMLLTGRRIERTLELLNWILVVCILGGFSILALLFVSPIDVVCRRGGILRFRPRPGRVQLPAGRGGLLLVGGVCGLLWGRWRREHHLVKLGARQRLWHGRARRLHSRGRRRP